MITQAQLAVIMPNAGRKASLFLDPLNAAMAEFEINTTARATMFLAQVAHESAQLRFTREIWGPMPWQLGYEGRADLGNTEAGDGYRFLGRGLLQCTGRDCYRQCSLALYGDDTLLRQPEILEEPLPAARSAGWVWRDFKRLNPVADAGDFERTTRRINGGLNGQADRIACLARARAALA